MKGLVALMEKWEIVVGLAAGGGITLALLSPVVFLVAGFLGAMWGFALGDMTALLVASSSSSSAVAALSTVLSSVSPSVCYFPGWHQQLQKHLNLCFKTPAIFIFTKFVPNKFKTIYTTL